ncbi:protein MTSS 1 isoform X2 [Hydra vulgaris]|uniref:Protein MTSS 1 isoform X2 n=1 Tax=Hydra vulgaris TaxID=6087 RepID=A0ABM4DNS9_HYDVU
MGETEESGDLFTQIMSDMKAMGPFWDDLLLKSTKFYISIKQTVLLADNFLDAFQKIADSMTNSKGGTRDIGIAFTKIVMRHKSIENKLKTYVGILADSLVSPMQTCIDEWKKNSSQLEKDHTKDYKRLKNDLKKACTETVKLKKKAAKKIGKQEYTDQYRDAMRVANQLCSSLENQEKDYLRKLMTEERSRATFFFDCYKPCIEQELTLISEIEQLQTILEDTNKLCANPKQLPIVSEDAINAYKVAEYLQPGKRDDVISPLSSPLIVKDRSLSVSFNHSRHTLPRSSTMSFNHDPIPVSVPQPNRNFSEKQSMHLSYSSSDSIEKPIAMYDPVTLNEIHGAETNYKNDNNEDSLRVSRSIPSQYSTNSWSSIETCDSSGIGSYNSLSSQNKHVKKTHRSGSDSDVIEIDCDDSELSGSALARNDLRYATIDRSHFKRNMLATASVRSPSIPTNNMHRSNSFNSEIIPEFPDYKMNLPKSKHHTVSNKGYQYGINRNNPSLIQAFNGHSPAELLKRLSPASTPNRSLEVRRNSSPVPSSVHKPINHPIQKQQSETSSHSTPSQSTIDNEPEAAIPGSFLAELQKRRMLIRRQSNQS